MTLLTQYPRSGTWQNTNGPRTPRRSRIDPPTMPTVDRSEFSKTEPQALQLPLPSERLHHGQEVRPDEGQRAKNDYMVLIKS